MRARCVQGWLRWTTGWHAGLSNMASSACFFHVPGDPPFLDGVRKYNFLGNVNEEVRM